MRTAFRTWLVLALALVALAGPAWAAPPAADEGVLDVEELERRLETEPGAHLLLMAGRYLPALVGLVLLVVAFQRRERGLRDAAAGVAPAPPQRPVPTVPFPWGMALALGAAILVVQNVLVALLVPGLLRGNENALAEAPLWKPFVATTVPGLVLAALVALGRRRRGARPAVRPVRGGLATWCLSSLAVIPAALLWVGVMEAMGRPPQVQELVQRALEPDHSSELWTIFLFGTIAAPIWEEAAFRGLLYPTLRKAFGGTRRGVWVAAIATSLAFAGVHASWTALGPLFALSLVLVAAMERTNSLCACILAHAAFNASSLLPFLWMHYT